MNIKISQKGFIQTPLLVGIIVIIVISVWIVFFLYKQRGPIDGAEQKEYSAVLQELGKAKEENEKLMQQLEVQRIERSGQELEPQTQIDVGRSKMDKEFLLEAASKVKQMYQGMEEMVNSVDSVLSERILFLDTLYSLNNEIVPDSYLNELILADKSVVVSTQQLFAKYGLIAKERISKTDELSEGVRNLEGLIPEEGFNLLLSGILINAEWCKDWTEEIDNHFEKYFEHTDFANRTYSSMFTTTKPLYSIPNFFLYSGQGGYPDNLYKLRKLQALESIAKQLQNIYFKISF